MLIAAHALASECVLVTANEGEFSRVADLRVENWLVDSDRSKSTPEREG
jgi:tRNA(fMet)-specific endonuclease VapC